jgi:rubredoxin
VIEVGAIVLVRHSCFECKHEGHDLRGTIVDPLPGGATFAFLAELDEPWECPGCGNTDLLICTDTIASTIVDPVTLLGEIDVRFKVGDRVSWLNVGAKRGVVTHVSTPPNEAVCVDWDDTSRGWLPAADLRHVDAVTQLGDMLRGAD